MTPTPAPPAVEPFHPAELHRQVGLSSLRVEPAGTWAVYVRRTIADGRYRETIWRLALDGTSAGARERLAAHGARSRTPALSPDGSTVLLSSDHDQVGDGAEGPCSGLYAVPSGGGPIRHVATLPGAIRSVDWCADGRTALVVAPSGEGRYAVGDPADPVVRRVRDLAWRRDDLGVRDQLDSLWLVDTHSGTVRRLTGPTFSVAQAIPSPDGSTLVVADLDPGTTFVEELPRLYRLRPETGDLRQVMRWDGPVRAAAISQRGVIAVLASVPPGRPGWSVSSLFVLDGDTPRQLAPGLDRPVSNVFHNDLALISNDATPPLWLTDRTIAALVSDRGCCVPYEFGPDGSFRPLVDSDDAVCHELAAGGGRLIALAAVDGHTSDVCLVEDGRMRPLTPRESTWHAPFRREVINAQVRNSDGHRIDAWFLPGRGVEGPGPVVLAIHGGQPSVSHSRLPQAVDLALADAGIGVLWSNPRGSGSYGARHALDDTSFMDREADDLLQVVRWAVESKRADPDRIGVTGMSGGGYMTNWLLAFHPGVFAAAVSENPVTDMVAAVLAGDSRLLPQLSVDTDLDELVRVSPYRRMHENRAPTLFIQSDDDHRCPPHQTELAFRILRERAVATEMLRYPGENHEMAMSGRLDRRIDRLTRIVDWFNRHLGPLTPRARAAATRLPIDIDRVREARVRIAGRVVTPPLVPSEHLSEIAGAEVLLQLECHQPSGSFKVRGVLNALAALDLATTRGITCASAGNHARAVAWAAREMGVDAIVCLFEGVHERHVRAVRDLGAEVRVVGQTQDEAIAAAIEIAEDRSMRFLHPFDDPDVIAGHATVALDILERRPDLGTIVLPVSGGGLASGVAIAARALRPGMRIVAASPAACASMRESVRVGHPVATRERPTLADCLAGSIGFPNRYTLDIVSRLVDELPAVEEAEILDAIRLLATEGIRADGAGATSTAAILGGHVAAWNGPIVAIVSGGNIDDETFEAMAADPA